jgi:hypothetical protein
LAKSEHGGAYVAVVNLRAGWGSWVNKSCPSAAAPQSCFA